MMIYLGGICMITFQYEKKTFSWVCLRDKICDIAMRERTGIMECQLPKALVY